ncbi:MAG: bacillithiol biosynthesis cysteine-adding enzyme BshC [bacterium]|nr:bacillithiol biosynthesis cysteine-adding enzyme BshC [bacterium]
MKEIDLVSLGTLSLSTIALLRKDKNLTDLIGSSHPYLDLEKAIAGKTEFAANKRRDLVNVLEENYSRLGLNKHPLINSNITALLDQNTYTVTTGQQLHLFLGPAFMVYKLLSTIKAAEYYQHLHPDKKFIPIFWLASEDHDFEEIKDTPLFGQNYTWITEQKGACGRYHLKDIQTVFEPLKAKLSHDVKGLELLNSLELIYTTSETLSDATVRLTHQLFADYGLLCLDADNALLKTHFKSIVKAELLDHKSEISFNHFSQKMTDSSLSLQLKSRPINLFYLKNGLRARIEQNDEDYIVVDSSIQFTKEGILAEIESHPENFSPNAVLRPIYQECILPNIAYVGGNAEINYWLQLKEIFELYQTNAPLLVLRQSVWIIRNKQVEWLEANKISIEQLFAIKTEKDKLDVFKSEDESDELSILMQHFIDLKNKILQYADGGKLPNIKGLIDSGKNYEKSLKELTKAELSLRIEKNDKKIKKLEQIQNEGFSANNIQERTNYALSFWIKDYNYLNNCFSNIQYKPGYGFFLNI